MTRGDRRRTPVSGALALLLAPLVLLPAAIVATPPMSAAAAMVVHDPSGATSRLLGEALVETTEEPTAERRAQPSGTPDVPPPTETPADTSAPTGPSEPTATPGADDPAQPSGDTEFPADTSTPTEPPATETSVPPTDPAPAEPAPTDPAPTDPAPADPVPPAQPKFGTYGDSLTTYSLASIEEGRKAKGSWTHFAQSAEVGYAGYWAKNGATTADALQHVSCHHDEILVLLLGTNDITKNVSRTQIRANLRAIVRNDCAEEVLLLALPPRSDLRYAATTVSFNASLKVLAAAQGWTYLDPWTKHRAANGAWLRPSMAPDGLHATRAVYAEAGYAIRSTMQAMIATPGGPVPVDSPPPTQPTTPVDPKFGTYGDSHTTYSTASIEEGRKAKGSWTHFAQSAEVGYAGYWAKNGATTADALRQVSCHDDEILVLLLGTNDITKKVSRAEIRANLRAIVRKECEEQVLLLALPPRDLRYAASTVSFNTSLEALAAAQGWSYLDPWTNHRAKNGTWLRSSYAPDGLHATRAVYAEAGYAIRSAMQKMVR